MTIHITKALEIKINNFLILLSLILVQSCSNGYTKSDYLTDYETFVISVKNNWKTYDINDWNEKSNQNDKYYVEFYEKFSSELKASEIIRIQRFNFVFHFYKGDITISKLLSGEYNDIFKGLALEANDIIYELKLMMNDVETEKNFVIINKLLE